MDKLMNRKIVALVIAVALYIAALLAIVQAQAPSLCRISGVVYGVSGAPASGVRIIFTPVSVAGIPVSSASITAHTDTNGNLLDKDNNAYIELIQGAVVTMRG